MILIIFLIKLKKDKLNIHLKLKKNDYLCVISKLFYNKIGNKKMNI